MSAIDAVLRRFESGTITRREALAGLTAIAASTLAASGSSASTFGATGLNHIALRVTDLDRSVQFYQEHLGLGVLRRGSRNCFLSAGGNNFVALFLGDTAGLDHYCYTVPDYDAAKTVERLEAAGLEGRRREDRVYFDDPDGLTVQLSGEWDDYPGPRPR